MRCVLPNQSASWYAFQPVAGKALDSIQNLNFWFQIINSKKNIWALYKYYHVLQISPKTLKVGFDLRSSQESRIQFSTLYVFMWRWKKTCCQFRNRGMQFLKLLVISIFWLKITQFNFLNYVDESINAFVKIYIDKGRNFKS